MRFSPGRSNSVVGSLLTIYCSPIGSLDSYQINGFLRSKEFRCLGCRGFLFSLGSPRYWYTPDASFALLKPMLVEFPSYSAAEYRAAIYRTMPERVRRDHACTWHPCVLVERNTVFFWVWRTNGFYADRRSDHVFGPKISCLLASSIHHRFHVLP